MHFELSVHKRCVEQVLKHQMNRVVQAVVPLVFSAQRHTTSKQLGLAEGLNDPGLPGSHYLFEHLDCSEAFEAEGFRQVAAGL